MNKTYYTRYPICSELTMPCTATSCICPFNFICDKQIAMTLKCRPAITWAILLFRLFRANSWEAGWLRWWHICVWQKQRWGDKMITKCLTVTHNTVRLKQQSYLWSACKHCLGSHCKKQSTIFHQYPCTHKVCLCLVHLQPSRQRSCASHQHT